MCIMSLKLYTVQQRRICGFQLMNNNQKQTEAPGSQAQSQGRAARKWQSRKLMTKPLTTASQFLSLHAFLYYQAFGNEYELLLRS